MKPIKDYVGDIVVRDYCGDVYTIAYSEAAQDILCSRGQLPSLAGPVQIGIRRVVFWPADKMSLVPARPTIWKGDTHGYNPG